jgi:DNA adenine methylase
MKAYMTVKTDVENLCLLLLETERDYLSLKSEESRKSYFLDKREKYNEKSLSDVENTALFIFLNRICFNGLYRVNRKGDFNVSFGKYNNPTICDDKTLYIDSELLRRVKILTGDYAQTLRYAKENTLFYLDPPYKPLNRTSNFNSYTKENFNDVEQIRLKYFCDELESRGYYWMLSNSDVKSNNPDNNFFDDLYSNYQISRVWASRSVNADAGKRGKVAELLIKNYDQRDMFCKAINSTN